MQGHLLYDPHMPARGYQEQSANGNCPAGLQCGGMGPYTSRKSSGDSKSHPKTGEKRQKTEYELKEESEKRKLRRTGGVTASNNVFINYIDTKLKLI